MKRCALVLSFTLVSAAVAASATAAPRPLSSYDAQVRKLLAGMTLDEKVGQMTQADHASIWDRSDVSRPIPRLGPERRQLGPRPTATRSRRGREMNDGYQRRSAQDAAAHPAALRRRRRARPQQRARRRRLPAQRRPRLHARRRAGRAGRARHRGGGARDGRQLDLRAVRDGAARHPLGPHVRGLLAKTRRSWRSWARPRCAASRARTSRGPLRVLACAKHYVGDGGTTFGTGTGSRARPSATPLDQGDTRVDRAATLREHAPAGLRRRDRRPASARSCPPTTAGTA